MNILRKILLNRCFYELLIVFVSSILIFCQLNKAFRVETLEGTTADGVAKLQISEVQTRSPLHTCPESILCVPKIQCPAHVRMPEKRKPQACDLPGGQMGHCCVTGQNHTADAANMLRPDSLRTATVTHTIFEEAHRQFEKIVERSHVLAAQPGLPDFIHSMVFHSTPTNDMRSFQQSNSAMEQVITTQLFTKHEDIPVDDIITSKFRMEFENTPMSQHCSHLHTCPRPSLPYRAIDGSCNNPLPRRSLWGAAGQSMERLLPPAYEDGIWIPRMHGRDGSLLASARRVSRLVITDSNRPHPKHNLLLMQFGQFISHDISQSAATTLENGAPIECCAPNGAGMLPPSQTHFACFPIPVEPDDEFYGVFKQSCMNVVRLSLAPNSDCTMSYGKQRNQVTHYLDASTVYGSSVEKMHQLRAFRGGKLRMLNEFGHSLLPLSRDKITCHNAGMDETCFESGDSRTNIIISLTVIHLLFAREHNRVAEILAHINPNWSDDKLFQEARRIVIAELQHIVYNEYLPAIVGPSQIKRFRLDVKRHGFANGYSPDINPAITNEFSGAAFRMGHSSVDGWFRMAQSDEVIEIANVIFNPRRLRVPNFYDHMLKTLIAQPMQMVDNFVSHGLTRYLFRGHNPFGLDLGAIDIQRGRDQSLRPYNDYLELMGLRKLTNFNQLPVEIAQKLSKVYRHPDDIDLWVGGLLEKPVDQGVVGITFAEIISDQFSRLKRGDRFYYEYNRAINPGAFSVEQLREIRKASMARIICDNADHPILMRMPPSAFVRTDHFGNDLLPCNSSQIPFVDLTKWRQF